VSVLKRITTSSMFTPLLVLALILLFNVIVQPGFLSVEVREGVMRGGLINTLNRSVPVMLLAIGMTLVISTGGVDLSVGSVLAIGSAVAITLIRGDDASPTENTAMALGLVVIITLLVGVVCGLWNGVLVAKIGMPPIIATLIFMVAGRGLTQNITGERSVTTGHLPFSVIANGSTSVSIVPYALWYVMIAFSVLLMLYKSRLIHKILGKEEKLAAPPKTTKTDSKESSGSPGIIIKILSGIGIFIKNNIIALCILAFGIFGLVAYYFLYVPGIPNQIWIALVVFLIFWFFTRRTALGLFIESVGANRSAARLSGIKSSTILIVIYAVSGLCAAIAGILSASNVRVIEPMNTGRDMELDAILAVVLGGTNMKGGKFNLGGSCVGAIILMALTQTMTFYGVNVESTMWIKAVVIVIIILIQSPTTRKFLTSLFKKSSKREVTVK